MRTFERGENIMIYKIIKHIVIIAICGFMFVGFASLIMNVDTGFDEAYEVLQGLENPEIEELYEPVNFIADNIKAITEILCFSSIAGFGILMIQNVFGLYAEILKVKKNKTINTAPNPKLRFGCCVYRFLAKLSLCDSEIVSVAYS